MQFIYVNLYLNIFIINNVIFLNPILTFNYNFLDIFEKGHFFYFYIKKKFDI